MSFILKSKKAIRMQTSLRNYGLDIEEDDLNAPGFVIMLK